MKQHTLYFHRNIKTGTIFYVGIGTTNRPWAMNCRSQHWTNVVNKYGGFIVEFVHTNLTWEQAKKYEIKYIKKFGRKGLDKNGILVNKALGGEGAFGRVLSMETRARIKQSNIDHWKYEKHPQNGRKLSEETKKKISQIRTGTYYGVRGKPMPEATKEKLRQALLKYNRA